MFRFVGWLVVTGLALYGAGKFVEEHVVVSKQPGNWPDDIRPA